MIAITAENTKNLPTTVTPKPQTWDKRDRAVKAAILALGPEAMEKTDFTIERDGKRFIWKAVPADKRPAPTSQQIKANGGKAATAVALTFSEDDRIAGEAIAAAALAKKTADKMAAELMGTPAEKLALEIAANADARLAKTALDLSLNKNGLPKFLERTPETKEEQVARTKKHERITGPNRVIRNPPDAGKAKAKADKEKKTSMMFVGKSAILAGKTNDQALVEVKAAFPKCVYKASDMQWIRRKLVREGKLSETAPKTTAKGKSK